MNSRDKYFLGIIGLLILIIILRGCGDKPNPTKPDYKYITDTLYVDKPYQVIKTVTKITPPKTIIKWKRDTVTQWKIKYPQDSSSSTLTLNTPDSSQQIKIDEAFLTQYPGNSKLINADLSLDSFKITTLNIQGQIQTEIYPMYYDRYQYQWYDNKLHREKIKPKKVKDPDRFKQLYVNVGYELLSASPFIGVDYQITLLKKLRFTANTQIDLQTIPTLRVEGKIGYRLTK